VRNAIQQAAFWSDNPSIAPIISANVPSASKINVKKPFSTPSPACRCTKARLECLAYTLRKPPSAACTHQARKAGCVKWPFVRNARQQAALWTDNPSIASSVSPGTPLAFKTIVRNRQSSTADAAASDFVPKRDASRRTAVVVGPYCIDGTPDVAATETTDGCVNEAAKHLDKLSRDRHNLLRTQGVDGDALAAQINQLLSLIRGDVNRPIEIHDAVSF